VASGPTSVAAIAAVLSIVVKEGLYHVTLRAGTRADSQATIANAHHHRSDAFTSAVALVGIGGAQLGWAICDPLAGTLVSVFIAHAGWKVPVLCICFRNFFKTSFAL
jgi:divalent metal cation (Fe/Co/Zn/Cd) transporter